MDEDMSNQLVRQTDQWSMSALTDIGEGMHLAFWTSSKSPHAESIEQTIDFYDELNTFT